MEFHPIANAYPLLTGDAYKSFVDDIRTRGVCIPIVIYDGMILDGRNRYLAAQETGRDCPNKEFNGTPDQAVAEVASLNEQRRHLTLQQRACISAKLANLKHGGDRTSKTSNEALPLVSREVAMKSNGVSRSSHERAKVILKHGTDEEKAALEAGTLSSFGGTASAVRARTPEIVRGPQKQKSPNPKSNGHTEGKRSTPGVKARLANGFATISEATAVGIEVEMAGGTLGRAVQESSLTERTYTLARDIVLLAGRTDLSSKDMSLVKKALKQLDENNGLNAPYELVKPLVSMVWGPKGNRFTADKKRIESFFEFISGVAAGCMAIGYELTIPYLGPDQKTDALDTIHEARGALDAIINRIKEGGTK